MRWAGLFNKNVSRWSNEPMYMSVRFLRFWWTVKESGHRSKSAPNLGYQLGKCGRPWQMWQTIGHSPQFSLKQRLLGDSKPSGTFGENLGEIARKVVFSRYCREHHRFCPKWGPMKQNELVRLVKLSKLTRYTVTGTGCGKYSSGMEREIGMLIDGKGSFYFRLISAPS